MKIRNRLTVKILSFILVMSVVGISVYAFLSSDTFNLMWLRHVYGNTYPLDKQERCLVVELENQNSQNPDLKFYDTERREFVHLDLFKDIKKVYEIRPGYYALFDRHGMQVYSIVMPYASEDISVKMSDEIQVIDCFPKEWYRNTNDSTDFKLPRNIKEAETQLVKLYEESGQCGYELIDYSRGYRETLDYDFEKIKKETNVSILTSPDKKIRFYTWDTGTGGTSPNFTAYVQYNDGKSVVVDQFAPLTHSIYLTKNKVKCDGYMPYDGAWIDCLYQIELDGDPVYITSAYNRASSREGGQDAYAFKVVNGLLEKVPFVDKDGHEVLSVGCLYDIPDWYFKTDGLGWDWIPNFDNETNTFYLPETGDMEMSDRYDKYQFKDGKMRYVGNGAGFWLHPSLHDFKRLCGIYQTKTKFIRVDLIADGNYRYAAWNKKNAMSETPELVIIGGKTDEIDNAIVFEKDDYQYIVPAYKQGSGDDFGKFIIKKKGKVIQMNDV